MKRPARSIFIIAVIACILAGFYGLYRTEQASGEKKPGAPAETAGPAAGVKVVPIKDAAITASITAYGEVVPAPGAVQVVSVPYESRIRHVMVSTGQKVSAKDVLLELDSSPDTYLQLEQARNAYKMSRQSLTHVRQLFDLKLATNTQLLQAEQKFKQDSLRLDSLNQRGIGGKRILRADVTGLVSKVYISEGAIVPAGNPLVEIVAQNRLEARLGVEPEDISRVYAGQSVLLSYVDVPSSNEVTGMIRKISRAVNPETRLVDVFVTLPGSARFLLGEYIMGRITAASSRGMVVPRSAVLPENGHYVLYTVKNGHAVKHVVQVGIKNASEAGISGAGIVPGEEAVYLGNYELKDGMAVAVESTR